MDSVLEQIGEWLKELLVSAIMNQLTGLFDSVNTQVGDIATQVGTTPANFAPGVFAMIRNVSESVIIPIAGLILTFIACYELIQMIIDHNNLANFETWIFFKWVFKTFVAVTLITNTFNIVMAVFDVTQNVINHAGGLIAWSTAVDASALETMQETLEAMKLSDVTARVLEKYYMQLLKTPSAHRITQKEGSKDVIFVAPPTVRKVHNVLRSAFHQAVKWELMEKNPAMYATVPKAETKKREIWDAPTLFHAIEVCEDERLKLSINLAFACSLRIGELLGLTWDCVDISPESIAAGKACIYVNKELQRVSKSVMKTLEKKDVLRVFPELRESNKTVLVLKKPKTATSTRKIFLPKTVAEMLVEWKRDQDFTKEALGSEYADFDLVMANGLGMPTEQSRITTLFAELIEKNDLPKVVFHSLRHSSITYKLKLNGGDIKSVQGDSGHAQAQMVTDQYSHILDDDRKNNAALFERAFYSGKGVESVEAPAETEDKGPAAPAGVDPELLAKILSNPEMAALLTSLAKSLN